MTFGVHKELVQIAEQITVIYCLFNFKIIYEIFCGILQENITFGVRGELVQVDKQISAMLLLGLFISRGLVSTLLLKPVECGLMEATPSNLAASNLKVRKRCVTFQVARPLACKTFGLYVLI